MKLDTINNESRALFALSIIKDHPSYDETNMETSIADIITDLLHLAKSEKLNLNRILQRAQIIWNREYGEELAKSPIKSKTPYKSADICNSFHIRKGKCPHCKKGWQGNEAYGYAVCPACNGNWKGK